MFKEALLCGLGLVVDISGSHYVRTQRAIQSEEGIASDWKIVGQIINRAAEIEGPKIKAEAAKQLQLKLG